MKKILFFLGVFLFFSLTGKSWAILPFATDDIRILSPGLFEFSSGTDVTVGRDGKNLAEATFIARYGILDGLETQVELPYLFWLKDGAGDNGVSDIGFKLKYILNDETESLPPFGFSFTYKMSTGDVSRGLGSGSTQGLINFVTAAETEDLITYFNLGCKLAFGGGGRPVWTYGAAAGSKVTDKLRIFLELTGEVSSSPAGSPLRLQVIANNQFAQNCFTNIGVSFGLNSSSPQYVFSSGLTLGL